MTMIIPITAVPSQTLNVVVGGQRCRISLYQKSTGLFFDLIANDVPVTTCVICRDAVNLINGGFIGNFAFIDTLGASDPTYDGLGVRYFLVYLE